MRTHRRCSHLGMHDLVLVAKFLQFSAQRDRRADRETLGQRHAGPAKKDQINRHTLRLSLDLARALGLAAEVMGQDHKVGLNDRAGRR